MTLHSGHLKSRRTRMISTGSHFFPSSYVFGLSASSSNGPLSGGHVLSVSTCKVSIHFHLDCGFFPFPLPFTYVLVRFHSLIATFNETQELALASMQIRPCACASCSNLTSRRKRWWTQHPVHNSTRHLKSITESILPSTTTHDRQIKIETCE